MVILATKILVGFVAFEHVYFAILEMLLWNKPRGRKVFGTTEAFANESRSLAANQGLYNLFLVAGLVWSLVGDPASARALQIFFLGCVVVAGVFGGLTANIRILFVQAIPAAIALALVFAS
jgi:putative membrane protein